MGEEAVIDLPLGDRPLLDLTDAEALKIYAATPTGYGKILKNQARWAAFADIAVTVKEGYKDYLRGIFGGAKAKPEPAAHKKTSWKPGPSSDPTGAWNSRPPANYAWNWRTGQPGTPWIL